MLARGSIKGGRAEGSSNQRPGKPSDQYQEGSREQRCGDRMSGNHTQAFSLALIDAAFDKDEGVRQEIAQALRVLGARHPQLVLTACHDYLSKHSKLVQVHRVIVLHSMEAIAKDSLDRLEQPLARKLISLASDEMTRSKDVQAEWQAAASQLLVALGCRFINEVMEDVLQKFQPGVLPHLYIVHTLGNLSTANVYGMVPFLTAILGTMLPMLAMAKQDSMKSVFTIALAHFSESILEYLANLDKAPDPTVRKDAFSAEIFASYDILFNGWLQHKDPKLRSSVVEAVGQMSHLMPHDKLEEQLPRMIPGILNLYRKHSDHLHITQSLCHVLDAAVEMGSRVLETQIDNLLNTLHPQICTTLDYNNHTAVKNHNEVLRCFTVLACAYTDRLVAFLLQKLEVHNEKVRIGTLTLLKHLVNSTATQLDSKRLLLLTGMKLTIQDNNNYKVRQMLAQVISAMAHHDYLELEGGEAMVEFIIRQCALPCHPENPKPRTYDPEEVTEEGLRDMCDNILNLLTTTVKRMQEVLWPFLLEFVMPVQYLNALAPVCRSLAYLGTKRQQAGSTEVLLDYVGRDLPTPHALLTRLLVLSSFPYRGRGRGVPALRLLQAMSALIHPQLGRVWDDELPPLIQHLEENSEETLAQRQWEDKLLLLLSRSLETVTACDEGWSCQLSEEMSRHLHHYNSFPQEKGFLYKCAGVVLRQIPNSDVVRKQLMELLQSVRHPEILEREGIAVCVGFCATTHLDDTLSKLQDFGKSDILKKSPSLFHILKDKSDVELEKAKSTVILCYGYLTLHAPEDQILARVEKDVVKHVLAHFNTKVRNRQLTIPHLPPVTPRTPNQPAHCGTVTLPSPPRFPTPPKEFHQDISLGSCLIPPHPVSMHLSREGIPPGASVWDRALSQLTQCSVKDEDRVRSAAFTVFGNLSRVGDGESKADFLEQVHSSMVSLLLHLNDTSHQVVKSCKFALRLIGPLMGSANISAMFQKHLLEEAQLHYGEFINDLAKHIINDFPEKINFYIMGNVSFFRSTRAEIRGNAAMFTGFLLGNLLQAELQSVSLEHVCGAIIMLLRDAVPAVRIKAAEALSLLHEL
ncbi:maestro heat-like repeat-containing protein family member 1 [Amblyraja radiata]|uniref:maestro heat-like repeat-containing protein family member 1 n=1 Tax=Amblyraja radiata TaxID=386614 RepID=UPI0014020CB5|nr:maestro heat-like repeat-containing protein family member 1 [Amblyraja radiata]